MYGSARESYLKTLDTIHHQGIRLALGAFRTAPADSLLVEANEPSLNDRREKLSLQFALKLKSNRSNPTYNTAFRPNYFTIFQNKPNAIPTFGIRIAPALNSAGIKVRNIQSNSILNISPWTIKQPEVLFTLTTDKKETTDSSPSLELNFKSCHLNIQIFSIYTQTVQKMDRMLHQPVYLGFTLENALYLIMHPYSQQKSKPLIWLWIT